MEKANGKRYSVYPPNNLNLFSCSLITQSSIYFPRMGSGRVVKYKSRLYDLCQMPWLYPSFSVAFLSGGLSSSQSFLSAEVLPIVVPSAAVVSENGSGFLNVSCQFREWEGGMDN